MRKPFAFYFCTALEQILHQADLVDCAVSVGVEDEGGAGALIAIGVVGFAAVAFKSFGQIGCRREACREQQGDEEEEEGECFCFYREQPPVVISMDKPR